MVNEQIPPRDHEEAAARCGRAVVGGAGGQHLDLVARRQPFGDEQHVRDRDGLVVEAGGAMVCGEMPQSCGEARERFA